MERLELRITGRVQGVGFRWHTCEQAQRLGLSGWVRNRADGSVQVVAEGGRDRLEALAAWAAQGPARARVDGCEAFWSPATGLTGDFRVAG